MHVVLTDLAVVSNYAVLTGHEQLLVAHDPCHEVKVPSVHQFMTFFGKLKGVLLVHGCAIHLAVVKNKGKFTQLTLDDVKVPAIGNRYRMHWNLSLILSLSCPTFSLQRMLVEG